MAFNNDLGSAWTAENLQRAELVQNAIKRIAKDLSVLLYPRVGVRRGKSFFQMRGGIGPATERYLRKTRLRGTPRTVVKGVGLTKELEGGCVVVTPSRLNALTIQFILCRVGRVR